MTTRPIRVLMVEDSPTDASLVLRELARAGFTPEFVRVDTSVGMRDALARAPWDIILCDWAMPSFDALSALDVLHESKIDLPFIIVSGTVGEAAAVEAMRHGANDYVLKDRLARLGPAVERELRDHASRKAHAAAAQALRDSELRLAHLTQSGIIGVAMTSPSGGVLEANDAYLALIGRTRDDLDAGRLNWQELTPTEWEQADQAALEELLHSGAIRPREKELFHADGSRVPVLFGAALMDADRVIAFYVDLSERKRTEQALHRTEAQLRHAQKMDAIGSLAGGVAHDFNNLLSVILSYAELLSEDLKAGDPLLAGLQEMKLAGERAAALTRQLLMFSRQQVLHPTLTNLNEMVATTDRMLRRLIGEDVEIIHALAPNLPPVFVDPDHMTQVILNLAVNARDAMPLGGKLTLETALVELDDEYVVHHPRAKPGLHVMLAVSDTGIGMSAETQSRVFEPFFTTKEAGRGTGLGLSTVFGIVQQSGGTVWLYSELDRGSTFRVYLPVAKSSERSRMTPVVTATIDLRGDETVLVVEDEERVRALACTILRRFGYNVLEAAGGGDALLLCEQHPARIHLLLTDVIMPRMSGRQLAERLAPLRPGMRVLYVSGYTANAVVRHGIVDSDVAFLQKPFTPELLGRAVREALAAPARG